MLTFSHFRQRGDRPDRIIAGWLSRLHGLLQEEASQVDSAAGRLHTKRERPQGDSWKQRVARAVEAIEEGRLSKVVLARELRLSFGRVVDHQRLLSRLSEDYPGCTVFAVRFGDATLVGATPERLLSVRQGEVISDALAGTLQAEGGRCVEAMVRHEHMPVVDAILAALKPHCSELEAGVRPASMRLQQLSHFHTRVRGKLKSEGVLFEIVEALHPTPAVGGLPRKAALEWIRKQEGVQRGWYTGACGWLGGAGEAELSVVLRCGLIKGKQVRLFAGAGITQVSDPAMELAETTLKLAALLDRLSS